MTPAAPCWRVIIRGWATLQELQTWWSIDEVMDACDLLDAVDEAEREARR